MYLSSFASFWPQILGLIGSRGVVPAVRMIEAMRSQLGSSAFWYAPSLFWFNSSDSVLVGLCAFGCLFSVMLAVNVLPRFSAAACFLLYLSISTIGQPFTSFQWDALLLEAGFLALFAGAPWLVWAYRLLLFRLMFESGWVKLASGDPNWRNLHALRFHFMTQPLPNPIAYYVYRAPGTLLDAATALTLAIEFIGPVLLFVPGIAHRIGAASIALLQILILLTGNYAFFNWLTLALCIWALDPAVLSRFRKFTRWRIAMFPRLFEHDWARATANAICAILIALGAVQLMESLSVPLPSALSKPLSLTQPFEIVNAYGLFAIMTTSRTEIVLEGSADQTNWREYEFPYKPGDVKRPLPWVAPYQPRLDWQMWFAALGDYQSNNWVGGLMYRLLTGEPQVLRLLRPAPFARPPRYLRALAYQYDFTTFSERSKTGAVWNRRLLGVWFGPVSLRQE
ncbi:MAG TPA: lipase maturation factor family protein [Bryobacteraceae bacterium]|nr:lipase maturation factor family protein [Bryobacteraceae bacterium]